MPYYIVESTKETLTFGDVTLSGIPSIGYSKELWFYTVKTSEKPEDWPKSQTGRTSVRRAPADVNDWWVVVGPGAKARHYIGGKPKRSNGKPLNTRPEGYDVFAWPLKRALSRVAKDDASAEEEVRSSTDQRNSKNGNSSLTTPRASDIADPPKRVKTTTYRVLRDTKLAREVKEMHEFKCQICGDTITLPDGSRYAEAHHVKPLGDPHGGDDIDGNIVCLCPNHHAMCDLGAIELSYLSFNRVDGHEVVQQFIEYHNLEIYRGTK